MNQAIHLHAALAGILDLSGFIAGKDADARYRTTWTGVGCEPVAVLRPKTPEAVAATMAVLYARRQPVLIQGGMTGLVGACEPQPGEVVLSLERLNVIEEVDTVSSTMTVQAGVPLEQVQQQAAARGLMFPVDIGSKGSCQIGGIIATNAGGNRVLRYGMTRNSVLGLEVVLPDGTVVSRLGKAIKDNAGYDLKHLFIGSEGTLGVITRAVLSLQDAPASRQTALVSVQSFSEVTQLLKTCRRRLGSRLTSFEVMWRDYYDLVTDRLGIGKPASMALGSHLVLVEAMGTAPVPDEELFTEVLGEFLEGSAGSDAVVARSIADATALWAVREAAGEAAQAVSPFASFDVSLPIENMEMWVHDMHRQFKLMGLAQTQTYGHLGDGNLHLTIAYSAADPDMKSRISDVVHHSIGALGGSIAGEHGIGLTKKPYLGCSRSASEIALMRTMKQAIDPHALLNRGRIFDPAP